MRLVSGRANDTVDSAFDVAFREEREGVGCVASYATWDWFYPFPFIIRSADLESLGKVTVIQRGWGCEGRTLLRFGRRGE